MNRITAGKLQALEAVLPHFPEDLQALIKAEVGNRLEGIRIEFEATNGYGLQDAEALVAFATAYLGSRSRTVKVLKPDLSKYRSAEKKRDKSRSARRPGITTCFAWRYGDGCALLSGTMECRSRPTGCGPGMDGEGCQYETNTGACVPTNFGACDCPG